MSEEKGREQQAYVKGLEIPQRWWELFRCKALDTITARAIDGNPNLDAARATVRIANANTAGRARQFLSANWRKSWVLVTKASGGSSAARRSHIAILFVNGAVVCLVRT